MARIQAKVDKLFELIQSEECLVRELAGQVKVLHYEKGSVEMKEEHFSTMDEAIIHFSHAPR